MLSLIQPVAAAMLAALAFYGAGLYAPLYDPQADMGSFPLWAAGCGAVTGWMFLGRRVGKSLWLSGFLGVQAIVLAAVLLGVVMGIRGAFVLGYRRRYDNLAETFQGFIDNLVTWFSKALDPGFLIAMGLGAVVVGVILHAISRAFETRRNTR